MYMYMYMYMYVYVHMYIYMYVYLYVHLVHGRIHNLVKGGITLPWKALKENVSEIRAELRGLLAKGGQMVLDPAYPRLTSVARIGFFTNKNPVPTIEIDEGKS